MSNAADFLTEFVFPAILIQVAVASAVFVVLLVLMGILLLWTVWLCCNRCSRGRRCRLRSPVYIEESKPKGDQTKKEQSNSEQTPT